MVPFLSKHISKWLNNQVLFKTPKIRAYMDLYGLIWAYMCLYYMMWTITFRCAALQHKVNGFTPCSKPLSKPILYSSATCLLDFFTHSTYNQNQDVLYCYRFLWVLIFANGVLVTFFKNVFFTNSISWKNKVKLGYLSLRISCF